MKSIVVAVILRILLLTTVVAAWPWTPWTENIRALAGRQEGKSSPDESSSTAAASASNGSKVSATATPKSTGKAAATTGAAASSTEAGSSSGIVKGTKTTSGGKSASKTGSKSASITEFDPRLPPGGISMVQPAATDPASYYKIGDYVTFKWNYTSVSMSPSAVDIMATCTANAELYTLAVNQSVEEASVTWDTGKFATGTAPLLTETYTLIIYDAASSISATPKAGYLGTQSQFVFAMYKKQDYTPLNEFKCATCSGALSDMERHALGFTLTMACITLLSFTWFVGGFGAFF